MSRAWCPAAPSRYAGFMEAVARTVGYDEFLRMEAESEDRLEFHDGVVVAMVAPSIAHQRICGRLYSVLESTRGAGHCRPIQGVKVRVEATNRTLVPDVVVVCGSIEASARDPGAVTNPRLIVEVLSPSTEDYDLGKKFAHYRRLPTLAEYVTVAQDRRFVTVARRVGDLWRFDESEGPSIALESVEIALDFDGVYVDGFGDITEAAHEPE